MKKHLYEVKPGERFTYGGVEWVALDVDAEVIALAAEPVFFRAFDDDNKNDWRNSSLRRELNGKFIDALVQEGAAKGDFVPFESDLTADDGMTDYGTATDVIALLTCDLYREFRALIPKVESWCWTMTPWTCDPEYSYYVRSVNSSGALNYSVAYRGNVGVRPLCHLKSGILVSVPDEEGAEPGTALDMTQTFEARDAILSALDDFPVDVWGDALGAAIMHLFAAKNEADAISAERVEAIKAAEG